MENALYNLISDNKPLPSGTRIKTTMMGGYTDEHHAKQYTDTLYYTIPLYASAPAPSGMAEMVDRFLTWPVPADVYPDGIAGEPGRTGTNLLTADQARQMLEYVLAAAPAKEEPR